MKIKADLWRAITNLLFLIIMSNRYFITSSSIASCNHVSNLILFLAALSRTLFNQLINRGVFKDGHNAADSLEGVAGVSLKEAACDVADDTLLPIQPLSLQIVSQQLSTSSLAPV